MLEVAKIRGDTAGEKFWSERIALIRGRPKGADA